MSGRCPAGGWRGVQDRSRGGRGRESKGRGQVGGEGNWGMKSKRQEEEAIKAQRGGGTVSYTHLRAHETEADL
eukprot:461844-Rhodomonas_salina.1